MSNQSKDENAPIPKGQKLFDNLLLLIVTSIIFTTLLYNVWGVIDLFAVPPAP